MMKSTQFHDEPSMEEALASIRQIINNEIQDAPKEPLLRQRRDQEHSGKKSDALWPTHNEVLELTELVLPDGSIESLKQAFQSAGSSTAQEHDKRASSTDPLRPAFSAQAGEPHNHRSLESSSTRETEPLLSPETLAASAAAMASLSSLAAERVAAENIAGSKTLEQLMQDMLRPMLREWLDAHLPGIIRTVVREQIEKVSQHQRGS
jgi:cell pole-organizing protein PopZ